MKVAELRFHFVICDIAYRWVKKRFNYSNKGDKVFWWHKDHFRILLVYIAHQTHSMRLIDLWLVVFGPLTWYSPQNLPVTRERWSSLNHGFWTIMNTLSLYKVYHRILLTKNSISFIVGIVRIMISWQKTRIAVSCFKSECIHLYIEGEEKIFSLKTELPSRSVSQYEWNQVIFSWWKCEC
jgi:hypothetical protein